MSRGHIDRARLVKALKMTVALENLPFTILAVLCLISVVSRVVLLL
jgi:hypothetical protein